MTEGVMLDENWCAEDTITAHEEVLNALLLNAGFSFSRQHQIYRTDSKRSYWLDFAWPEVKFAVEIDGHPVNLKRESYLWRQGWTIIHLQNEHFHTKKEAVNSFRYIEEFIKSQLPHSCQIPANRAVMSSTKTPPVLEKAGRELLACAIADKALAARVRQEFPVERYPSEVLRRIAMVAYGMIDISGEINTIELWAHFSEDEMVEKVVDCILDYDIPSDKVETCALGCMLTLELAEAKGKYHTILDGLNEVSDEEQRDKLRKFMEIRGNKINPRALPKRK